MILLIIVILLVLMLIGSAPYYPYNRNWGYGPSGIVVTLLVILLIVYLAGGIPARW
jgi:hypothetical protein